MSDDAISYFAGWLAFKFKDKYPALSAPREANILHNYSLPTWIQQLSFGGLVTPSDDFLKLVKRMNRILGILF
jgi:hypothetical protein